MESMDSLQMFIDNIMGVQDQLIEDLEIDTGVAPEEDEEVPEEEMMVEEEMPDCNECVMRYVQAIDELTAEQQGIEIVTDAMAESLAEIDPNTENAEEGKALLRKMYKLRGVEADQIIPLMPETPGDCIEVVAGKVLQLEQLEENITKAASFRDFFAEVYCMAYVNSLVTMKDGLSQIFPGGLDW